MNALAVAVRQMLVEGPSSSDRDLQSLSDSERKALAQLSSLSEGTMGKLLDRSGGINPSFSWILAPEYAPVQA